MIRIIKPGMQEFYAFCTHCGCEFTYELSDINLSGTCRCPTCEKAYYHLSRTYPSTRASEQYEGNRLVANPQISLQDFITPCVDGLDAPLTGGIDSCNCRPNAACSKCSGTSGTITATNSADVSKLKEKMVDIDLTCLCKGDVWKSCNDCGAENSCCSDSESSCTCKHTK